MSTPTSQIALPFEIPTLGLREYPPLSCTPEIERALHDNAVVALGISGGKDSSVMAYEVTRYLDSIGHTGTRLLVHADLGMIEWTATSPTCETLARELDMELAVVRRAAGGMVERWEGRWAANMRRYADLACVKVILPWSTPAMRFCTSELKVAPIMSYLRQRFVGQTIVSATGIRRQESSNRAKAEIAEVQPRLHVPTRGTSGYDWHPILEWRTDQVFRRLREVGHALHEAYWKFGSSRLSCSMCILATADDQMAALRDERNHPVYLRLVELEATSTFAFQSARWLGDLAPALLSDTLRARHAEAKERAAMREAAEARIPKHLLYTKGWPTVMPTASEAALLAHVRRSVADTLNVSVEYTDPISILHRYAELMDMAREKAA